jgi:hypothetical protein
MWIENVRLNVLRYYRQSIVDAGTSVNFDGDATRRAIRLLWFTPAQVVAPGPGSTGQCGLLILGKNNAGGTQLNPIMNITQNTIHDEITIETHGILVTGQFTVFNAASGSGAIVLEIFEQSYGGQH